MCLDIVDKQIKGGKGVGYKYFDTDKSGHLCFPYYGGRIKYDHQYQDKAKGRIERNRRDSYPTGFHIFLSQAGAVRWGGKVRGIRRVEYQDVVASGIQGGYPVVVARSLYIHKKADRTS